MRVAVGTWASAICLVQLHGMAEPARVPAQAMDIVSLLLSRAVKGLAARLATPL